MSLGALGTADDGADDGAAHFCFSSFVGITLSHRNFQPRFTSFFISPIPTPNVQTRERDELGSQKYQENLKSRPWPLKDLRNQSTHLATPPYPEGHGQEHCLWIIISFGKGLLCCLLWFPSRSEATLLFRLYNQNLENKTSYNSLTGKFHFWWQRKAEK